MNGVRWLLVTAILGLPAIQAKADHFFVLKKDGASGLVIERVAIADGESKVIVCGSETGNIDVILPVGPGGSGSLARHADGITTTVTNERGSLSLAYRDRNGKEQTRPGRTMEDLKSQDIRVSVTGQNGTRRAFLIAGYETVKEEPVGPVIDMFAGRIPLSPGDHVVCTDTYRPLRTPRTYGEAAFEHDRHLFVRGTLSDGREGNFLLDVGAGQSVISREFLPHDTKIEESSMVQYSAAGKELLKYEPGGATGKTQSVLGTATLEQFSVGDLKFTDVEFAVLPSFPGLFDRPVMGILGLDLLRRAEVFTLEFDGRGGRLVLSRQPTKKDGNWMELPIATVQSHLAMRGEVNGVSTSFVVDTGAPEIFLDQLAAQRAQVAAHSGTEREVRGLDEGAAKASRGTIKNLRLGDMPFADLPAFVSALPVFSPLRGQDQAVGLLGNSVLSQFTAVEFDLVRHAAQLKKR